MIVGWKWLHPRSYYHQFKKVNNFRHDIVVSPCIFYRYIRKWCLFLPNRHFPENFIFLNNIFCLEILLAYGRFAESFQDVMLLTSSVERKIKYQSKVRNVRCAQATLSWIRLVSWIKKPRSMQGFHYFINNESSISAQLFVGLRFQL